MAKLKEMGPEFDVGSVLGKAGGWLKKRAAEDINIAYRLLPGGEKATIGEVVQLGGDLLTFVPIPGAAAVGVAAKGAAIGAKGAIARGGIKAGEEAAEAAAKGISKKAAKAAPTFTADAINAARKAGVTRGRTATAKELDFVARMRKSGPVGSWAVKDGTRRGTTASNFRDVMLAKKGASMGKAVTKNRVRAAMLGSGLSSIVNVDSDWFSGGGAEETGAANGNYGDAGAVVTGPDGSTYRLVPDRAGAGGLQGTNAAYAGNWVRTS